MDSLSLSKKQAEGGLKLQAVNAKASNKRAWLLLDRCIGTALFIKFKPDGEQADGVVKNSGRLSCVCERVTG